jgi:hypothetical protein
MEMNNKSPFVQVDTHLHCYFICTLHNINLCNKPNTWNNAFCFPTYVIEMYILSTRNASCNLYLRLPLQHMQLEHWCKIIPSWNLLPSVLFRPPHPCSVSSQHAPVAMYHLTILPWKTLLWFSEVWQDLLELSFQIVLNHSIIKKSNLDLLIFLKVKNCSHMFTTVLKLPSWKYMGQKVKVTPCLIKHQSMQTYKNGSITPHIVSLGTWWR